MFRKSLACISALSLVGSSLACAGKKSDVENFLTHLDLAEKRGGYKELLYGS